ncbi:uncharacterized protein TNIN_471301 [Trichonephila inaurata madagascariensis]|uniref:Uncharacterized protein n=1 Tax=Trichonephila inaurata madagascariensis TaxID=2747483 RepID=A0A8X6Y295_9ARAC|nr:uncharacterized protein TNIN_471301 [Trichonephila inaurata madagascariensis]
MAVLIIGYQSGSWRIDLILSCGFVNILSVILWYSIYFKRRSLSKLVAKMKELYTLEGTFSVGDFEASCTNIGLLIYTLTPTLFAFVYVSAFTEGSKDNLWAYGYELKDFSVFFKILLFVNVNMYESLQIIFPGILTCTYCTICYRLSKFLVRHNKKILNISQNPRFISSAHLVKEYFAILDTVDLVQKIFSEPIFLLVMMHFVHMFSMMAYYLSFTADQFSVVIITESIIVSSTTALSTIIIIIYASKIAIKMKIVQNTYRRCKENCILNSQYKYDIIIQLAIDRELQELSACDVVFFQKSLILSLAGALLTYGLLIFQIVK